MRHLLILAESAARGLYYWHLFTATANYRTRYTLTLDASSCLGLLTLDASSCLGLLTYVTNADVYWGVDDLLAEYVGGQVTELLY